ncbi:TadE family type IV pilus minor pilin [Streptomyces griseiscabiei]|uniref:TadE family type IV pilus minor pilin n=2 Tax=Streptomyces griseiscabiei TaxID=2993540 RepID=A0ABU4L8I2_9ACTN|nr:TadE family type IV pilus minor pilin [Streptomyces griseiscabiei]MBZ3906977.1 pilus assembly protein [Streptomyces griseiscabiei]MDX2911640.1 TadE family type IV pilus minor pilin [Streptomyces griseiscabiei]
MAGREPGRCRRALRGDQGFVTAEAAIALPVLVLLATALVWGLLAACAQIQVVDAARAGARAAARQDPSAEVVAVAREAAPDGAEVSVGREGDLVRVVVSARAPGPRGLGLDLSHTAVALAEETVGAVGMAAGEGVRAG